MRPLQVPVGRRPAVLALATALVLAAGPASAQGLVQGVLGLAVSPAPGTPPAQVLRGGVALRLERVEHDGRTWRQLLASDGHHGWTAEPLGAEHPLTARAPAGPFELMPLPPGDADFPGATGRPVPEGSVGILLGGSRESQVADTRELMRPAWLNPGLAPWPRWDMGGIRGYAPLAGLALSWAGPAGERASGEFSVRDRLGAWGLEGLTRAPFLAPLAEPLQRHAPAEGAPAIDLSNAPDKPAGRATLRGAWQGPLYAYRAATAPKGGLAALLGYGQGAARAFVFIGAEGDASVALADDDHLDLVRVEEADLDGDGRPEWLLELVGLYGDGYYSELWIVDGRKASGPLRIRRQALSRGPGDNPGAEQDAAWGLNADRSLWIWRSTPTSSRMTQLRYRRGTLAVAAAPAALLVLGTDERAIAAQQRRMLALQASPAALVLPQRTAAGLRWITALPANTTALARRWAAQRVLPASAVLPLPGPAK